MAVREGGGHLKQQIKNRTATVKMTKLVSQESVTDGNNLCKYTMCKYTSLGYFLQLFSLALIEDEQLSVSGERMCTILVNRLED